MIQGIYLIVVFILFLILAPHARSAWSTDHFTVGKGGVVFDSKTGLEWYVGRDRNTAWNQAKSWTKSFIAAGGLASGQMRDASSAWAFFFSDGKEAGAPWAKAPNGRLRCVPADDGGIFDHLTFRLLGPGQNPGGKFFRGDLLTYYEHHSR